MIRFVEKQDAAAICTIYNYYVVSSIVTFEEIPVTLAEMEQRIGTISAKFPWIVYEEDGIILGYAYATDWKLRTAYKKTVETSVYLTPDAAGKGLGKLLYRDLILYLKEADMHVLIGGISLPNDSSVRLHEYFGFEKVGHLKEVGYKFDKWVDVGYWELVF